MDNVANKKIFIVVTLGFLLIYFSVWNTTNSAATPKSKTIHFEKISANAFYLKDKNGNIRAAMTIEDGNPGIAVVDMNGIARCYMALYKNNPAIIMKDKQGKVKFSALVADDGEPFMKIGHKEGGVLAIGVNHGTDPTIFFFEKDRKPRLCLGVFDGDQPSIGFWQKDKKVRMAMGLNKNQEPLLWLADQNGRPDLSLGRHEDKPQINLTRGQSSVALGMVQGDEPYIFVKHGGKVVWKATGTVVPDVSIPDELMRFERPKKSWQEQ